MPRKKNQQSVSISNCSVTQVGIQHTPESAGAIVAIGNALEANARALERLSESLSKPNANFGSGIYLGSLE